MSSERILITGGAGFVGSNIALFLRDKLPSADIVCMDNLYRRGSELNVTRLQAANITFHRGDVRHPDTFPQTAFDWLIECSAEPSVLAGTNGSPDYLYHSNLTGLYHCLEKARLWGSRIIFLSTSRVYPIARLEAHPWIETETRFEWQDHGTAGISSQGVSEALDLTGARSLYGFTKLAGEQLIEEYRAAFGLKAIINRCGVLAGPWQFGKIDQGVIALWVMSHVFRRPLSYIGYSGLGKQVRDVLHVADLCDLLNIQMRDYSEWEGWVGNVAGGHKHSLSLQELTTLCHQITGNTVSTTPIPESRPFDLRIYIGDCSRLFERTCWRPKRSVADVISDTYEWVRSNQDDLISLN
ncbi:NAD-dependent epimerase/dehydratase family protein [soil metagenome]